MNPKVVVTTVLLFVGVMLSIILPVAAQSLDVDVNFHTEDGDGEIRSLTVSIKNMTDHLVSILWDECTLVLPDNTSERIIRTGGRYLEKAQPQAPTTIAPHTIANETIWPAKYISWTGKKWARQPLPIRTGDTIQLYLAWEDSTGKHHAKWSWTLNMTGLIVKPNSFSTEVAFTYEGSGIATTFSVTVYDLSGHAVWSEELANVTEITWDGTNEAGMSLVNGPYIYEAMATDGAVTFTGEGMVFLNRAMSAPSAGNQQPTSEVRQRRINKINQWAFWIIVIAAISMFLEYSRLHG